MILAEAPRPNRPKKDESVLHMMSFSCILLRAFDAFVPLWVAFSYCIGWDIGGALICF